LSIHSRKQVRSWGERRGPCATPGRISQYGRIVRFTSEGLSRAQVTFDRPRTSDYSQCGTCHIDRTKPTQHAGSVDTPVRTFDREPPLPFGRSRHGSGDAHGDADRQGSHLRGARHIHFHPRPVPSRSRARTPVDEWRCCPEPAARDRRREGRPPPEWRQTRPRWGCASCRAHRRRRHDRLARAIAEPRDDAGAPWGSVEKVRSSKGFRVLKVTRG
jgi:hypothetical protein